MSQIEVCVVESNVQSETGNFESCDTIKSNTNNIEHKEDDDEHSSNDDNVCVICLDSLDEGNKVDFQCGHTIHIHCCFDYIKNLFEKKSDISCPICRTVTCKANTPFYNLVKQRFGIVDQERDINYGIIGFDEIHSRNYNTSTQSVQQEFEDNLNLAFKKFIIFIICVLFVCIILMIVALTT